MLQDGGNPWRGMLYGMANRIPWAGNRRAIRNLWDELGMQGSRMVGYWVDSCPVKTGEPDVLATAFLKQGRTLISIASWAKCPVQCRLQIDWAAVGIEQKNARLTAPAIPRFQPEAAFNPHDEINVPPGRGWLLILHE